MGFIYVKLFSRSCSHSLVGYSPSQLVLTHVAPRCMHADSDCVLNLQLGEVLSVKTQGDLEFGTFKESIGLQLKTTSNLLHNMQHFRLLLHMVIYLTHEIQTYKL